MKRFYPGAKATGMQPARSHPPDGRSHMRKAHPKHLRSKRKGRRS